MHRHLPLPPLIDPDDRHYTTGCPLEICAKPQASTYYCTAALGKYDTNFCDFFAKTTNRKPQAVGFLCVFMRSQDGF